MGIAKTNTKASTPNGTPNGTQSGGPSTTQSHQNRTSRRLPSLVGLSPVDLTANLFINSHRCAWFAKAAYPREASIRECVASIDWDGFRTFQNSNAAGTVAWTKDTKQSAGVCVISIAGTDDWRDVLQDAAGFIPTTLEDFASQASSRNSIGDIDPAYGPIAIGLGFAMHARDVLRGLREIEDSLPFAWGKKHVWITGHSLGGAAAAVLPLLARDINPQQIVTFGAPRWLIKGEHGYLYDFPLDRWVSNLDFVPDLPRISGVHVGDVRYIHRGGKFSVYRSLSAYLARAWVLTTGRVSRCRSVVEGHSMNTYIRALAGFEVSSIGAK